MKFALLVLVTIASAGIFYQVAVPSPRLTFGTAADDQVLLARFSLDSKTVISSQKKKGLQLWNVSDGSLIRQFKSANERPTQEIRTVSFSADGKTLIASGQDRDLVFWDIATGKELRASPGDNKETFFLHSMTPDDSQILTVDSNSNIKRWDAQTGKLLKECKVRRTAPYPNTMEFAKDGRNFLLVDAHEVFVCDLETLEVRFNYDKGDHKPLRYIGIGGAKMAPDAAGIIFCNREGKVVDLDFATGMERRTLDLKSSGIRAIRLNAKGDRLLAGCADGVVRFFSYPECKLLKTISGYIDAQISPDGKTALTFTKNGRMMLWDLDK